MQIAAADNAIDGRMILLAAIIVMLMIMMQFWTKLSLEPNWSRRWLLFCVREVCWKWKNWLVDDVVFIVFSWLGPL